MEMFAGFVLVVAFVVGPFAIGAFIYYKYGAKIEAKKRDRQIETQMRLAVRDADAQNRIAQKIMQERGDYGRRN